MYRRFALGLLATTATLTSSAAWSQTASMSPAERAQVQKDLADLNRMRGEFDARIRALEDKLGVQPAAPTGASANVPMTSAPVQATATSSPAQASSGAASDKSIEVYGFAQVDYIQDFKRVDPSWNATLRPSKIPTMEGQFGGDGQSVISARQSRFGVNASVPAGDHQLTTKFEFDLYGVGGDAGQTTIRLRHAYGEWGPILAGQTNTLFMDGDVFPNVIDYWGPTGMAFIRNPQFRVTLHDSGGVKFAMAIEHPNSDVDVGNIRELDPNLGAAIQPKTPLPDLTAQLRLKGDWGHLQIAGVLTKLAYDAPGQPNNQPKGSKVGGGIDVTTAINAGASTVFRVGVVYGDGIASYMNDGGMDLAPQTSVSSPSGLVPKAVPLLGVTAYVDHNWSKQFSSALGYSITKVWNTDFQGADAFESGQYASGNLLWTPADKVMMGVEMLWGRRTDNNGASGDDVRMQVSAKYSFSSGNLVDGGWK
jgi:hypothetical protein